MSKWNDSAPTSGFLPALRRALLVGRFVALPCTAVAALTATSAYAQTAATGSIEGRVQNVDLAQYLSNARVRIVGTSRETLTNQFGEFRLSGVPAGDVTLDVFYTGLPTKRVTVTVAPGAVAHQEIELTADESGRVVKLDKFVVESERETNAAAIAINEQRFAPNRKEVVSTDAFGDINQGNIGEFVKFMPGISLDVKDGNSPSGIMIRGFDPNYTNVTMDGGQLASTQIANTQTSSRGFLLEQANINNLARIEVVKQPTPDMSANSLGGSVNFVSKNAFESARPKWTWNAFLNANSSAMTFDQTPGPGAKSTYKIRPNFDTTYILPVNRKFGVVFNFAQASNYYVQYKAVPLSKYYTGGGVGKSDYVDYKTNPWLYSYAASYNPNIVDRTSGSIRMDWKPFDRHVLTVTADASANYQQQAGHTITYNAGTSTKPANWDATSTYGAPGTGSTNEGNSYQNRNGLLRHIAASWTYTGVDWQWDLDGSFSNSNNRVRDTAKGFWQSVSTSLPTAKTVNLIGYDPSTAKVAQTQVLDAAGNPVNERDLANYNITTLTSQPQNNEDNLREVRTNVTRSFSVWGNPLAVKFGGSTNNYTRDQQYELWQTSYVGPDGIANSGDESAARFVDGNQSGISPGFGRPGPQWPDPYAIYQAAQDHPTWFARSAGNYGDTIKNYATRSPWLHETVNAGYIMEDSKWFHNKLRLLVGVRYELTKDEGQGFAQNSNAIYVLDNNLKPVIDPTTKKPILLPQFVGTASGGPEQTAAIYKWRGAYNSRDYHNYFPGIHATYNITENLLFRAAYTETIGRPNISDIVPNISVSDNSTFGQTGSSQYPGFVSSSNTSLKPWTAKNYDYSLEYYLPHNGLLSVNWYKKDIRHFFRNLQTVADTTLLDQLGLPHDYVGYQYSTRVNAGNAMIKGWELNASLPLENLTHFGLLDWATPFAKHVFLTANATHLDLFGANITPTDWKRYIPRSRNFGVRWSAWKLSGNLMLNWKGRMQRDTSNVIDGLNADGTEFIRSRYQLDGNIDYQMTKHFGLFLAGRNILNSSTEWEVWGPGAATRNAMTNYERYGVQWSAGVRGSF